MRLLTLVGLWAGLLLLPAAAQQVERIAPAGNVLTHYLDRANIHPPVQLGRLTIFPISLSRTHRLGGVLTMAGALKRGLLSIEELDPPDVRRAKFVNRSKSETIFLMGGEVITGGRQSRTLASDALLGPDSAEVLPLYCVEKGRWAGKKGFAADTTMAPLAVRAGAARGADQKEIWSEVARANRRLGSATASEDLAAAMGKAENVKRLADLRGRILPKLPSTCAGLVLARGGTILAADLFNSAELFAGMRDKVLNSYLSQYGWGHPRAVESGRFTPPSQQEVRSYLHGCYRAGFSAGPSRGVGRIYHVRGVRTGQTLVYEGEIVPVRPLERPPVRDGGYMVHTALLPEVVPVWPDLPVPRVPRPPMPRPMPRPTPPEIPYRR